MKLHEILKEATLDDWFRPVSYKGSGQAYCFSSDMKYTELVPTPKGGIQQMSPRIENLLEDWEIVSPDEVCNE
jgi:hypothetical protein